MRCRRLPESGHVATNDVIQIGLETQTCSYAQSHRNKLRGIENHSKIADYSCI